MNEIDDSLKYEFIEDADQDSKALSEFYDFCWLNFRNQMRVMVVAFCETSVGKKLLDEYIASFEPEALIDERDR